MTITKSNGSQVYHLICPETKRVRFVAARSVRGAINTAHACYGIKKAHVRLAEAEELMDPRGEV